VEFICPLGEVRNLSGKVLVFLLSHPKPPSCSCSSSPYSPTHAVCIRSILSLLFPIQITLVLFLLLVIVIVIVIFVRKSGVRLLFLLVLALVLILLHNRHQGIRPCQPLLLIAVAAAVAPRLLLRTHALLLSTVGPPSFFSVGVVRDEEEKK